MGVSVSDVEAFPTLPMNPLGLQEQHQVQYGHGHHHMMDPHSAGAGDQYTPQGSVSPFDRSPHQQQGQGQGQGQNGFYAR